MKTCFRLFLFVLCFLIVQSSAQGRTESAGFVKSVSGAVFLFNGHISVPALQNMKVSQGDAIQTGTDGSIGLILNDDTVVSLGPNSEMSIQEFLFRPGDRELSFIARLVKGTFSFISGKIAKLSPESVQLLTPEATLGVRGTKFVVQVD